MKTTLCRRSRFHRGSTLLIVLGTVIVLSIALMSVLGLVMQEHRVLARTAAWNAALPAAEAGIEEAFAHLRQVDGGNRAVNGWVGQGTNFILARNLGENQFAVAISSDTLPSISSIGYVWCPSAGLNIERRVRVTTARGRGLPGMIAKSKVVINGQAQTDSYDSSNPGKSTNGQYDPAKRQANGFVGTNSKEANDLEISGSAKINEPIATGPGSVLRIEGSARVGDFAWTANSANNGKVQTGWLTTDMNVSFPNVEKPFTTGYSTPIMVANTYTLGSGKFQFDTLTLNTGQKMIVTGEATVYVKDTLDMMNTGIIIITNGGKLNLYVEKSTSISGEGIVNASGIPDNFNYYGRPANKQIYYSGKAAFIGTVYAPHAKMDLTGASQFMEASVSDEIVLGGNFQFHYDEALGGKGAGFYVSTWNEF